MVRYTLLSLIILLGMGSVGCSKVFWLGPEFSSADRDRLKMEKFRIDLRYAREEISKAQYMKQLAPVTKDLDQYYRERKENESYLNYVRFMNGFSQGLSEYLTQQPQNCGADLTETYARITPKNCY